MKMTKYLLAAATGFALSGCAVSGIKDVGVRQTGDMQASPTPNRFEVFFDPDGWTIGETAARILQEAADGAKQGSITGITLSVHAAAAGWDAHSQALSERRAEAVKAELVKDGVPATDITSIDVGRSQLAATQDGVREPQNRRTEIVLH
jgi:outer membrane protein OmpA-like peptidoglycan-associated protein